jgi:hypothetical protein
MKTTKLFGICAVAILIISVACMGCTGDQKQSSETSLTPKNNYETITTTNSDGLVITDFGNGVLLFDCREVKRPSFDEINPFGYELSIYLKEHPNMRVTAISVEGNHYNTEFYVIVEPRDQIPIK